MSNKGHIYLTPCFVKNRVMNQKHVYQVVTYFILWFEVYGCGTDAKI